MIRTFLSLLLLMGVVFAQEPADTRQRANDLDEAGVTPTHLLVQREQAAQAALRKTYLAYFKEAHELYPDLPDGLLEAVAYTASRWIHMVPTEAEESHHGKPSAYGIMGFYDGTGGFRNTLGEAAAALGVDAAALKQSPRLNILAGAALLDRYMLEADHAVNDLEDLVPVITRFSGLPEAQTKLGRFALDSHAYDVLLSLDRGADESGIQFEAQRIDWTRAFDGETLHRLKAPFLRMNPETDSIDLPGYRIDPATETLVPDGTERKDTAQKATVDYPGALWVASPYNWSRGASVTDVTIHTAQGSYAGTISWFQSNPYSVSAHYVIRSSDGQITQMVRESLKAAHVGVHNSYTVGIEHEGYVSSSSWYTSAMYNASAALTADICADNSINPNTTYGGAAHSGVTVLSTTYKVKGHQHYSSQTHTDPGIYWNWASYKSLVTGGGGGGTSTVLDNFESGEGRFYSAPTYSGSTVGISTASTAQTSSSVQKNGTYSEQIKLVDDSSTSSSWAVRFLSGGGSPSNNASLTVSGGSVGFWVYSGGTGVTAAIGVDDSDGTERSISRSIPANTWTWLSWDLDDASQWNAWYSGNGSLSASTVTIDAIWLFRAQTSYDVYVYIDDVTYSN